MSASIQSLCPWCLCGGTGLFSVKSYMLILGNAGRDPREEERVVTLMIQQRVDGTSSSEQSRDVRSIVIGAS